MARTRTTPAPLSFPALSAEQEQAMELVLAGQTVSDIAATLQLSCEEIPHWRHEHPVFVARLNQHNRLLWDEARTVRR